jgi:hypothetical protein
MFPTPSPRKGQLPRPCAVSLAVEVLEDRHLLSVGAMDSALPFPPADGVVGTRHVIKAATDGSVFEIRKESPGTYQFTVETSEGNVPITVVPVGHLGPGTLHAVEMRSGDTLVSVTIQDINGDGHADMIVNDPRAPGPCVLISAGAGNYILPGPVTCPYLQAYLNAPAGAHVDMPKLVMVSLGDHDNGNNTFLAFAGIEERRGGEGGHFFGWQFGGFEVSKLSTPPETPSTIAEPAGQEAEPTAAGATVEAEPFVVPSSSSCDGHAATGRPHCDCEGRGTIHAADGSELVAEMGPTDPTLANDPDRPLVFRDAGELDDLPPAATLAPLQGTQQAIVPALLVGLRAPPATPRDGGERTDAATTRVVIGLEPVAALRTHTQVRCPAPAAFRTLIDRVFLPQRATTAPTSAWNWLHSWPTRCESHTTGSEMIALPACTAATRDRKTSSADTTVPAEDFNLVASLIDAVFSTPE